MTDLRQITSHVSTAARDGFTRAELLNIRAAFREARADGLNRQVSTWLRQHHPALMPLFDNPTVQTVDRFQRPRQADSHRLQPASVTENAGGQIRTGPWAAPTALGNTVSATEFLHQLGITADHRRALAALQQNPKFQELWNWFGSLGDNPIRFSVVPGFRTGGAERFGGFIPSLGLLLINPTKPEHRENPAEMVDTLVHELIHAAFSVRARADRLGLTIPDMPFADGIGDLGVDPHLGAGVGSPRRDAQVSRDNREYMVSNYGDGASNPREEYIDINAGAQDYIIDIIRDVIHRSGVGRPTITFENQLARQRQQ